ncbi:MAG TPA: type II toxin-antitoxin system RelE/ParE family toxin [Mucilaginibacter sp.]|jgi:plasmid stabilization system protein ParE
MAKEVVLTAIAVNDFNNVIDYLTSKWGEAVKDNFIERFEKVTDLLANNPGIYAYFDNIKRIQKCLVTKHNMLYFIEKDTVIEIITIFDTRQDPEKLTSII